MAPVTSDPLDAGRPRTGAGDGRRPTWSSPQARRSATSASALPRLLVAALAVGTLAVIALPMAGGGDASRVADHTGARYAGIPQDGLSLGRDEAPVTVVEFVDLQCPACAVFATAILPTVVERYVRPGRVRFELRPLAFVGQDSVRAAQAVDGAAAEDAAWPYVERLFAGQGEENSGYVTEEWLRAAADDVPGLDADRVVAWTGMRAIAQAERDAGRAKITATPSFLVGPTDGDRRLAHLPRLDTPTFTAVLDRELARAQRRGSR
jgi:protein-disulfide isomerase